MNQDELHMFQSLSQQHLARCHDTCIPDQSAEHWLIHALWTVLYRIDHGATIRMGSTDSPAAHSGAPTTSTRPDTPDTRPDNLTTIDRARERTWHDTRRHELQLTLLQRITEEKAKENTSAQEEGYTPTRPNTPPTP